MYIHFFLCLLYMKRYALLMGLNYEGTSAALSGCINDVNHMKKHLKKMGHEKFTIMTDHTS